MSSLFALLSKQAMITLQEMAVFNRFLKLHFITTHIRTNINKQMIETRNQISVLGIVFDSRLQWGPQVTNTLNKVNNIINCLKPKLGHPQ